MEHAAVSLVLLLLHWQFTKKVQCPKNSCVSVRGARNVRAVACGCGADPDCESVTFQGLLTHAHTLAPGFGLHRGLGLMIYRLRLFIFTRYVRYFSQVHKKGQITQGRTNGK